MNYRQLKQLTEGWQNPVIQDFFFIATLLGVVFVVLGISLFLLLGGMKGLLAFFLCMVASFIVFHRTRKGIKFLERLDETIKE